MRRILALILMLDLNERHALTAAIIRRQLEGLLERCAGSLEILIEMAIFFAFCCLLGALIVRAYEWRQDVLYRSYVRKNDRQV